MKIRLLSDLHLDIFEDHDLYKSYNEDVLVLIGDISDGDTDKLISVLSHYSKITKHVIFVTGNHDYYFNEIGNVDYKIKSTFANTNVHFLNSEFVKIDDVTFIGATLWTNFRNNSTNQILCKGLIKDFSLIKNFSNIRCAQLFHRQKRFFEYGYEMNPGKKVFVSHFLPDTSCIHENFRGPRYEIINSYFANELGNWISYLEDSTWMFGHTHDPMDFYINKVRMVCNPYGSKKKKNENFEEKFIEI